MSALWASAAAEWAKPYRSAAVTLVTYRRVRPRLRLYAQIDLRRYICAYGICLGWGPQDAKTQICEKTEHVCKLLQNHAFHPRAATTAALPPPYRRENLESEFSHHEKL